MDLKGVVPHLITDTLIIPTMLHTPYTLQVGIYILVTHNRSEMNVVLSEDHV